MPFRCMWCLLIECNTLCALSCFQMLDSVCAHSWCLLIDAPINTDTKSQRVQVPMCCRPQRAGTWILCCMLQRFRWHARWWDTLLVITSCFKTVLNFYLMVDSRYGHHSAYSKQQAVHAPKLHSLSQQLWQEKQTLTRDVICSKSCWKQKDQGQKTALDSCSGAVSVCLVHLLNSPRCLLQSGFLLGEATSVIVVSYNDS